MAAAYRCIILLMWLRRLAAVGCIRGCFNTAARRRSHNLHSDFTQSHFMEFLIDLWLPILIGTFVLFMLSFIFWAVLPHHFGDHKKVPNEDALMDFLRSQNIPAGNYIYPCPDKASEQHSKENVEKYTTGPRGLLDVYEMPNMPLNMAKTIGYFFVSVTTIGYITHVACQPGAAEVDFMRVFRVAGTISILTYATSNVLHRVWFRKRVWTEILDGVVYGLVLGLIFASFWKYAA